MFQCEKGKGENGEATLASCKDCALYEARG